MCHLYTYFIVASLRLFLGDLAPNVSCSSGMVFCRKISRLVLFFMIGCVHYYDMCYCACDVYAFKMLGNHIEFIVSMIITIHSSCSSHIELFYILSLQTSAETCFFHSKPHDNIICI